MHAVKVNSLKRTDLMIGSDYRCYNAKLFTGDTLDTQSVLSKCTENSKKKKRGICVQRTTVFSEKSGNAPRKEQNLHFSF